MVYLTRQRLFLILVFGTLMTNACSRRNLLTKVRVNGTALTKDGEIKDGACRAFHAFPFETRDWRPNIRACVLECWGVML